MIFNFAILLLGVTLVLCSALCIVVLKDMWRRRSSRQFKTFYYRCCWNECCINLFTLLFYLSTMYVRYFSITFPFFYYLNRFKWWILPAQVTQEQILYIQIVDVFVSVGGRFCAVCLPYAKVTEIAEQMTKWEIFILQNFLPAMTVVPLYFYDHGYGIRGITMPLWLSAVDPTYDDVVFYIALAYRSIAFMFSFLAYISMFCLVRKKASRNETRILIHGACLLSALGAALTNTIAERLEIGDEYELMRLFYYTSILWVPCTDIITTFWVITSQKRVKVKCQTTTFTAHPPSTMLL